MDPKKQTIQSLTRELFEYYPDYLLCKNLAENVQENNLTLAAAIQNLAAKASAVESHRGEIDEKLNRQVIPWNGEKVFLKDLSLRQLLTLDDGALADVVRFYFKYPYAHNRTRRSRWLPQWVRSFSLRVLLGHAKERNLDLDYQTYFEMVKMI
jgi:hypothetical protein